MSRLITKITNTSAVSAHTSVNIKWMDTNALMRKMNANTKTVAAIDAGCVEYGTAKLISVDTSSSTMESRLLWIELIYRK